MLVGHDQQIDPPAGDFDDIVHHLIHDCARIGRTQNDTAVNHHVERLLAAVGARQRDQETIA